MDAPLPINRVLPARSEHLIRAGNLSAWMLVMIGRLANAVNAKEQWFERWCNPEESGLAATAKSGTVYLIGSEERYKTVKAAQERVPLRGREVASLRRMRAIRNRSTNSSFGAAKKKPDSSGRDRAVRLLWVVPK
jgi:hypothetical protein